MRPTLLVVAIMLLLVRGYAADALAQSSGKKSLNVFLALGKESKAATTFSSDVSTISAFWKGEGLEAGDKIKAIWIAEDIGDAAPKESQILEGEAKIYKPDEVGAFTLSRPAGKIWPVGNYAVVIYINGSLAQRAKFKIIQGVKVETH